MRGINGKGASFGCTMKRMTLPTPWATTMALLGFLSLETAGCSSPAPAPSEAADPPVEQTTPAVARDIDDAELLALVSERPDLLLIDVRTQREWDKGHIEGACFLDFLEDDFSERASKLPKDRPIAVYCAAGGRSADAMSFLASKGFKEVYNLRDGFYGWDDAGREVSSSEPASLPQAE